MNLTSLSKQQLQNHLLEAHAKVINAKLQRDRIIGELDRRRENINQPIK